MPILNRSGIYMYWNNSWLNNFNQKNYLLKTMFLESLLKLVCSERVFKFFFFSRFFCSNQFFLKFINNVELQKRELLKSHKQPKKIVKKKKFKLRFNFSRLWFIKFNGYLLVTMFCFFFKWKKMFKPRKRGKKKKIYLNKPMRLHFTWSYWQDKSSKVSLKKFFFF